MTVGKEELIRCWNTLREFCDKHDCKICPLLAACKASIQNVGEFETIVFPCDWPVISTEQERG